MTDGSFEYEHAAEAGDEGWRGRRRSVLAQHDLWERWGAVPPQPERDKPLEEYLPGGSEYEKPEP